MRRVVVAGSDLDSFFAVIDFTAPENPVVKRVPPDPRFPFGACRVAINGSRVAAGDSQGGDIRLVEVTNPSNPVSLGFIRTKLSGIAAIAIKGMLVAAGELFSATFARVMLIDFSSPANPQVLGIGRTPFASGGSPGTPQTSAISSVVFLSESVVIVSGPNDLEISRMDFTDPANPSVTNFSQTRVGGPPTIDAASGRIAVGDTTGPHVNLFASSDFSFVAGFNSKLFPVTSVALSDTFVLAGSSQDAIVSCIPLSGSPVQTVQANLGLGLVTAIDGNVGACGGTNSTLIRLVDCGSNPATLLGAPANVQFGAATSLGISTFESSKPGGGGGGGGHGGGGGGVVPGPNPHPGPLGPLSLRRFMVSKGLNPASGLRVIRPPVSSVREFIIFS